MTENSKPTSILEDNSSAFAVGGLILLMCICAPVVIFIGIAGALSSFNSSR